jgi:hypothetical protein
MVTDLGHDEIHLAGDVDGGQGAPRGLPLKMPVLAIGGDLSCGSLPEHSLHAPANDVSGCVIEQLSPR